MVPNLDEAAMHTVPVEPTQLVNLSAQFNVSLVSAPSGPKCIRRTDCPAASGMLKSILNYPNFLTSFHALAVIKNCIRNKKAARTFDMI